MKFAIATATYFAQAIIDLLDDNDYTSNSYADGTADFILVNTTKKTYKDSITAADRPTFNPTTDWAAIVANVQPTAAIATPAAAATAATSAPARATTTDVNGNTVKVGDLLLVVQPVGKRPKTAGARPDLFNLRPNGLATVTRITAKGAVGFAFDADNEFLSKRFQKVSLIPAKDNVVSGDLVVATPRRDGRFVLPQDTALTFRGVTVTKGNFILDGYGDDQYSPSRFQKVVKA